MSYHPPKIQEVTEMGSRCVHLGLAEEAPKFPETLGWIQKGIRTCFTHPSPNPPPSFLKEQCGPNRESPALRSVALACLDLAMIHCQSP